jgi:hypothetical protein
VAATADIAPQLVNNPDDFVAGDARELEPRPKAILGEGIAMANATCLDLNPHMSRGGTGDWPFDEFEGTTGTGDLGGAHGRHGLSSFKNKILPN